MNQTEERHLKQLAAQLRLDILAEVYGAKSGHPGGSLSVIDTLTYLYEKIMKVDPQNPKWEDRDRFVLSKGHTAPALYAILAHKGFFPKEELQHLRKVNHMLQGHPDMKGTPGIDMSTGSLGQGLSAAVGMALAAKLDGKDYRVFAVLGDGELQEGQIWEAAMFAGNKPLDNLIAVVDNNNLQINGPITGGSSPYPITDKFKAFNWNVLTADGHDFNSIEAAFDAALAHKGGPSVIVQKSIKGKGVSYMEDKAAWHGTAPNPEQYETACGEVNACLTGLEVEQ